MFVSPRYWHNRERDGQLPADREILLFRSWRAGAADLPLGLMTPYARRFNLVLGNRADAGTLLSEAGYRPILPRRFKRLG